MKPMKIIENPIDKPFKTIEIQVPRKHQVLAFITRCSTMVSSWEMTFPTRVPSMAPITATDTTKPQGMLCWAQRGGCTCAAKGIQGLHDKAWALQTLASCSNGSVTSILYKVHHSPLCLWHRIMSPHPGTSNMLDMSSFISVSRLYMTVSACAVSPSKKLPRIQPTSPQLPGFRMSLLSLIKILIML